VVDHHKPLDEELKRIGIPEVDHVAGLTGTDRQLPVLPKIIAPHGYLAMIDDPEHFDIVTLKRKSITVAWELMFTRAAYETADMIVQHRILEEVSALVDAGVIVTTMTRQEGPINADNLKRAHQLAESGRAIGKTVLAGF
jgi:NADPH:quinone reductase-like Zn-dependent oxidoreductase